MTCDNRCGAVPGLHRQRDRSGRTHVGCWVSGWSAGVECGAEGRHQGSHARAAGSLDHYVIHLQWSPAYRHQPRDLLQMVVVRREVAAKVLGSAGQLCENVPGRLGV